jgi:transmembrane sensor
MTGLPRPIRSVLLDPTDEATADRVLRGVDRARLARRTPPWALGLGFAGAACALLLAALFARDPGPLLLPDGSALGELRAGAAARVERLSDGTVLRLRPGASLRTVRNDGRHFAAAVGGGGVEVALVAGGPRGWSLDCGEVGVETRGAELAITRAPDRLEVTVRRGEATVRGARVAVVQRALRAGASFTLPLAALAPVVVAAPAAAAPAVAAPVVTAPTPVAAAPSWRALAARGRWRDAYDTLGSARIGRAARAREASVDDLLALADVARLSGHPAEAVAPLDQVLAAHADDPSAALAAITLGRLHLDALGRPAEAARALRRALALGVPASLEEDARARLVEALARAGDAEGARRAAEAYRARFPAGRRAAEVARLVAP